MFFRFCGFSIFMSELERPPNRGGKQWVAWGVSLQAWLPLGPGGTACLCKQLELPGEGLDHRGQRRADGEHRPRPGIDLPATRNQQESTAS